MPDLFADAINSIKVAENAGIDYCIVNNTKLIREFTEVMKKNNYIEEFEVVKDGKFSKIRVKLAKRINKMGIIKPRFAVGLEEFQKYETRFIPSKDFGILILSTPKGIMSNRDAKSMHMGGRLLAYVY